MGKIISAQGIQNFGEAFLSTIDRERKLQQQQKQFNQEMEFKNRQLNFMNAYREGILGIDQGNLDAREREQDWRERPITPEPITQSRLKPLGGGIVEEQFTVGDNGETIVGYESLISPDRSGGKDKDKIPLYDLSGSGKAFNEYRELEGTTIRQEDGDYDILGEKNLISGIQVKGLKQAKLQAIIDATDNEARKITQTVPSFYGTFQTIMGGVGKGLKIKSTGEIIEVNKKNVDEVVNKLMKNESSTTRDAMKTLLKRRIF